MATDTPTLAKLRTILRRDLRLGADVDIPADMPLSGGQADIDSLDILLLLTSIEREFGIKIPSQSVSAEDFKTVSALAGYIDTQVSVQGGKPAAPTPAAPPRIDYLARLPHGEGFRFISRVVDIHPGQTGHAVWALQGQEPFFAGHFPGRPLVPGVFITEALAQLSGLVAAPATGAIQGKLAHVDVRFEESVAPPAQIELHSRLTRVMGALHQFEVSASVGATVVARGTLALALSAGA